MNILFGALFIIIPILPGIIFRVSYLNIPYSEIKNLNITYQNESRINEMIQRMTS